jgi:ELWxxDGT repeat protein
MKNTLLTALLVFTFCSLQAQNLVKDIASSDANTIFKNTTQLVTFPRNDSLMLVDNNNLIYLFKTNPDTLIVNYNLNSTSNGKIRGIFKIKDFYVILSEANQTDYLVKISENNPPIIIWTSGSSTDFDISYITQIGDKLIFIDKNPNVCNCKRLVVHTGEYLGGSVIQSFGEFTNFSNISLFDNKLYFTNNFSNGFEPWVSDGTSSGTFQLGDLNPGSASSSAYEFKKFDNKVYFRAAINNQEHLFETNGTQQGTTSLFTSNYLNLHNFVKRNNEVFASSNSRLIKLNLSSQTQIQLLPFIVNSLQTFVLNNEVYFLFIVQNQNTNKNDLQLWKYDGANTVLIKTLQSDLGVFASLKMWQSQSRVFFEIQFIITNSPFNSFFEVWSTDGSTSGTVKITDLNPTISNRNISGAIGLMGDFFYFGAYNDKVGYELFKTDGTEANTKLTMNYNKKIMGSWPNTFFEFNNKAYFMADNNLNGRQLWSSDGTLEGTKQEFGWHISISNYNTNLAGSMYNFSKDFGVLGDKLIYVNPNSQKLFAYNATTQTDTELKNYQFLFQPFSDGYTAKRYTSLTKLNNEFIFADNLQYLWKTDGTTSGTTNFYSFASPYANPNNFLKAGNEVYFFTENPRALWRTNGQNSGTQVVHNLSSNQYIIPYSKHEVSGNKAYYVVTNYNSNSGYELWEVGTTGATLINSNLNTNGFQFMVVSDNALYFKTKINSDYYLMKRDLNGNTSTVFSSSSEISDMYFFKNKIFYTKRINYESWLYSTDGTSGNETPIKLIHDDYVNIKKLKVNTNLFMLKIEKYYPEKVSEIWTSDGSSSGTKKVFEIPITSDIEQYPNYSEHFYENSINVEEESLFSNNKLFFTMRGNKLGRELWVMDFSCPNQISITKPQDTNARFASGSSIQVNTLIEPTVKTTLEAQNAIFINPGTEIKSSSVFTANIKNCEY